MIYFDNNATTPLAPEVLDAFQDSLRNFGNPSSVHQAGQKARRLLNESREKIASLLGVSESTLTFTSGGTEAINSVLLPLYVREPRGKHLVVSQVEHPAVLQTAAYLESLGVEVTYLPVDSAGCIQVDEVKASLKPQTLVVAIMWANNETGNLYPVKAIGEMLREQGVLYLCDGVQAVGKLPVDLGRLPVDFMPASAHKFHGPKGVGFLYTREGVSLDPLIRGGRQERGQRAGTENLPGIAALAGALELADQSLMAGMRKVERLRDRLEQGILEKIPGARIHGDASHRLYNTSNISIPGVPGEAALINLDMSGLAISIGSACESGSVDPSHVLKAMGLSDEVASSGLRFSLSRYNTAAEVEKALRLITDVVERIRNAA